MKPWFVELPLEATEHFTQPGSLLRFCSGLAKQSNLLPSVRLLRASQVELLVITVAGYAPYIYAFGVCF